MSENPKDELIAATEQNTEAVERGNAANLAAQVDGNKTALEGKGNELVEREEQFDLEIAKMYRAIFGKGLQTLG